MTVSDFVRGGLYDTSETTYVMTHGEELGVWIPRTAGAAYNVVTSNLTADSTLTADPLRNFTGMVMAAGSTPPTNETVSALSDAVTKLHEYLAQQSTEGKEEGK